MPSGAMRRASGPPLARYPSALALASRPAAGPRHTWGRLHLGLLPGGGRVLRGYRVAHRPADDRVRGVGDVNRKSVAGPVARFLASLTVCLSAEARPGHACG